MARVWEHVGIIEHFLPRRHFLHSFQEGITGQFYPRRINYFMWMIAHRGLTISIGVEGPFRLVSSVRSSRGLCQYVHSHRDESPWIWKGRWELMSESANRIGRMEWIGWAAYHTEKGSRGRNEWLDEARWSYPYPVALTAYSNPTLILIVGGKWEVHVRELTLPYY